MDDLNSIVKLSLSILSYQFAVALRKPIVFHFAYPWGVVNTLGYFAKRIEKRRSQISRNRQFM